MSATLTYVYCLVRSARRPSLGRAPAGMPGGGEIRLVDVDPRLSTPRRRRASRGPRHWLVVSSVRERMYDEQALERGLQRLDWIGPRALAHEAVVEHFLSAGSVLPMQLFTLFKGDDRASEHIAADRRRVARILSKIEGQVEWGLRITWEPREPRGQTPDTTRLKRLSRRVPGSDPGATRHRDLTPRSGADYLVRKRDQRDVMRLRLRRARAAADRLYRAVAREAGAARRRPEVEQAAPGSRLLVDAALLVPAARARAFRAAVRRHSGAAKKSEIVVSLTGPWPAYNFI